MYSLPTFAHGELYHAGMRDDFAVVNADVLACGRVEIVVEIVILSKALPDLIPPLSFNFKNIDPDFRPLPFPRAKKKRC